MGHMKRIGGTAGSGGQTWREAGSASAVPPGDPSFRTAGHTAESEPEPARARSFEWSDSDGLNRLARLNDVARERFTATSRRFWHYSLAGSVVLAAFLALAVPTYGWAPFVLLGVPAVIGCLPATFRDTFGEHAYAIGHLTWLVALGFGAAFTGGADSFLLPLLPALALGLFSRLHPRMATTYVLVAFVLGSLPVLVTDWAGVVRFPWLIGSSAVTLITLTLFGAQMASRELKHRDEATIDQLTGLLNRRGLDDRLAQLSQRALVIGADTPIALLAADLDHFKAINDTYGHLRGDEVLRDVAAMIRRQLRRFELAYRMGGEEFLIVLPGQDAAGASAIAESIRTAIELGRPGGIDVTVSLGVAAGSVADTDGRRLLHAADSAVYAAKRAGRNRIAVAQANPQPLPPAFPEAHALAS
jgi:diguanylate cyclase (GGDEF)-like protein